MVRRRKDYYGNLQYANYPVVYVSWEAPRSIAPGPAGGCRPRRNGRRPRAGQMVANTRGAIRPSPAICKFLRPQLPYCGQDNSIDDGHADTAPVSSYPKGASPYGALNMAGNIWEWTADWYNASYYSSAPMQNPQGPASGIDHVMRGGSWGYDQWGVRAAKRDWNPGSASYEVGFRCARSP